MYELKCPSCGQVLRVAFVRPGAVTDCPRCAHRYRIKDTHVTRKAAVGAEGAGGDGKPSLLPGAKELASMAGARLRVDDDGNVIGLSGLSEMMRNEGVGTSRSREQAADLNEAPPPGRPPRPPSSASFLSSPALRRFAGPRSLYVMTSTICLGLAVVGVALWHASTVDPGGAARVAHLPMIMAVRLSYEPWERPNTPLDRADRTNRATDGVRLVDANLGYPTHGQPMLTASVTSTRSDVVGRARIHVSLVDQSDVEVARTQVEVALIASGRPYRLRLPVPEDLSGQWLGVASRVEVIETLEAGQLMDGAVATPISHEWVRGVRLLASNTQDEPLRRAMFLITALDEADQPIRRWRATWHRPVGAGQPIDCQVVIPTLPETPVHQWDVQMAGEPMQPGDGEPTDSVDAADAAEPAPQQEDSERSDEAEPLGAEPVR